MGATASRWRWVGKLEEPVKRNLDFGIELPIRRVAQWDDASDTQVGKIADLELQAGGQIQEVLPVREILKSAGCWRKSNLRGRDREHNLIGILNRRRVMQFGHRRDTR